MTRLPGSGARIDTPRRAKGELKAVLCDLRVAQVLDEAAQHELYWNLGEIIGQWSRERERLEVSPVAKALLSMANNLSEVSRLLGGLETGIHSDLEMAVSSRVANLLSMDPTVGSQSAQDLLTSFRAEADRIAHVCMIAMADLPQVPGERGRMGIRMVRHIYRAPVADRREGRRRTDFGKRPEDESPNRLAA